MLVDDDAATLQTDAAASSPTSVEEDSGHLEDRGNAQGGAMQTEESDTDAHSEDLQRFTTNAQAAVVSLAFQLDDHQHAQFADKILQIVAPTFPHPVAHGSGADPSDLHTTLLLYLWAVADSQAEFRTHRSKTKETCLIKEVDKRLHRNTYDFHSDPGPGCNQNCNIHQYHNGLADNVYRCDHVFPKRRKPKVEQGMCTVPGDTLIGEAKWWKTDTKLGSPETRQKVAEVEHVRSGFAKCLVWWCARYPSNANLTWKYTHFEVTFLNAQDCNDCKLRLSSLGLLLHWRS